MRSRSTKRNENVTVISKVHKRANKGSAGLLGKEKKRMSADQGKAEGEKESDVLQKTKTKKITI